MSDEDDDILFDLLSSNNEESDKPIETMVSATARKTLKELDFNFLDDVNNDEDTEISSKNRVSGVDQKRLTALDFKFLDEMNDVSDNVELSSSGNTEFNAAKQSNSSSNFKSNSNSTLPKKDYFSSSNSSVSAAKATPSDSWKKRQTTLQVPNRRSDTVKNDVYADPIFGFRMIKPLVSSAELTMKMQGRTAVTVSQVKAHSVNQAASNSTDDWVIAGVLMYKVMKTSVKGNQYCVWKITDLSLEMKTASIFLFGNACKDLWKTSSGVVIGVLNPSVLESSTDIDQATLSVDNSQKVMILGTSRDLGKCKSVKKNGDPCTSPVNLNRCEYCVYHVKQEYGKFSRRSDIQSAAVGGDAFGAPGAAALKKRSAQQSSKYPGAQPFVSVPAKRNEKLIAKDRERMALLCGKPKTKPDSPRVKEENEPQKRAYSVELTSNQVKKDQERLNKLRDGNTEKNIIKPGFSKIESPTSSFSLPTPKLGSGIKGGIIDFSEPIPQKLVNNAKMNAIEWIRKNGIIKKTNPNKVRPEKDILEEKGIKRKRKEENGAMEAEENLKKKTLVRNRFQELLEAKSSHTELLERREDEEAEKYFGKLEVKERMEEKMMATFRVECKAVRCGVCKYVAFSSSDLCKKLQHPIKVIDAVKKFFKCSDCGNRTISLDRLPSQSCKKCSGSRWVRTAMMDEKRTELPSRNLCIRGGEEKYIGSITKDASLNLLVPDPD